MAAHIKVLIADADRDFFQLLSDRLTAKGAETVGWAADGAAALELCSRMKPDVLLLDLVLPKLDGLAVLRRLEETGEAPAVFVVSALYNDELVACCADMGARFFTPKPCDATELAEKILACGQRLRLLEPAAAEVWRLESEVTDIIRELGVPAHINGYRYLREAILLAVDDMALLGSMTKRLYPAVADRFSTTRQNVEKSMRRAIENAWERSDGAVLAKYFGRTLSARRDKPSNSEFVAIIADRLLLERRRFACR